MYEATDFLATLQVRATPSGQAETAWIPTDILRALEAAHAEPGERFLIFLDEFNRCREMARNGIMPALDATRKLYNPLTGMMVDIPDNVLWIAAINNGVQFTGTTVVDPAQMDRFAPLKMDYPPEKEEVRILAERHPDVPRRQIERTGTAANAVRHDETLRVELSVRATQEVCTLLGHPNFADAEGDVLPNFSRRATAAASAAVGTMRAATPGWCGRRSYERWSCRPGLKSCRSSSKLPSVCLLSGHSCGCSPRGHPQSESWP